MEGKTRYIICIFMNFYENIKNDRKSLRPKLSLCHFIIEPVIAYDKCVDVMSLNANYLFCIFMNIDKMTKIGEKRGI